MDLKFKDGKFEEINLDEYFDAYVKLQDQGKPEHQIMDELGYHLFDSITSNDDEGIKVYNLKDEVWIVTTTWERMNYIVCPTPHDYMVWKKNYFPSYRDFNEYKTFCELRSRLMDDDSSWIYLTPYISNFDVDEVRETIRRVQTREQRELQERRKLKNLREQQERLTKKP